MAMAVEGSRADTTASCSLPSGRPLTIVTDAAGVGAGAGVGFGAAAVAAWPIVLAEEQQDSHECKTGERRAWVGDIVEQLAGGSAVDEIIVFLRAMVGRARLGAVTAGVLDGFSGPLTIGSYRAPMGECGTSGETLPEKKHLDMLIQRILPVLRDSQRGATC